MIVPSLTATYALRALVCLARRPEDWVGADAVAACADVPRPYLARILHTLSRAGLVTTKRGYRGGYRLSRDSDEIGVLEVLSVFDGEMAFDRCLLGLGKCAGERACPLHGYWSTERKRLHRLYRELTLERVSSVAVLDHARSDRGRGSPRREDRKDLLNEGI